MPAEYSDAYKSIKHYLWNTSGVSTIDPLTALVDLLEEAAAHRRSVTEVTGTDVAAFADELVRGEQSYRNQQRQKLNNKLNRHK